jgi:hypothetical protein
MENQIISNRHWDEFVKIDIQVRLNLIFKDQISGNDSVVISKIAENKYRIATFHQNIYTGTPQEIMAFCEGLLYRQLKES